MNSISDCQIRAALCNATKLACRRLSRVVRDRCSRSCLPVQVRFGPKATEMLHGREMTRRAKSLNAPQHAAALFDHFVGGGECDRRDGEALRVGDLEVDHEL